MSTRIGIPSVNQPSKFRGFRRKRWMATNAQMEKYIRDVETGKPAYGISRTWREGEPVVEFGRHVFRRGAHRFRIDKLLGEIRA